MEVKFSVVDTRNVKEYVKTPVEIPNNDYTVLRDFSILDIFGVIVGDEVRIYAEVYPDDVGEVVKRIPKTVEASYRPNTDTVQICVKYPMVIP